MKKLLFLGLAVVLIMAMPNCKKGGGGGGNNCSSEAAVSATTNPAINANEPAAPGPDFPLVITITNKPAAGVSIQVKATSVIPGSTPFFNQTRDVTTNTDNWNITGTPSTTEVKVEITITSKSCSTNKWTGSYNYKRK